MTSNATLSLYRQCPPGLGDVGCLEASCNSTFVAPTDRTLKSANATQCQACDEGFVGLNCNVCQGQRSCSDRQRQTGRGVTGVETSSTTTIGTSSLLNTSVNQTLTCNNQPHAVTAAYVECGIDQPTLSALFPGTFTLTGIKVANVPNFTSTGMAEWNAQANTSYLSVFLDGVEQFYCQATGCRSSNITTAVQKSSAGWGTEQWSCDSFSCSCPTTTRVCNNPTFPLASIIDQLSGSLDFPCDYVNPDDPKATTSCIMSTAQLNQFVGPQGLSLIGCTYGQCLSQFDLEQDWQQSARDAKNGQGDHLSDGVIAGLAILGFAIALLLFTLSVGYFARRTASRKPRANETGAIGMEWSSISYSVAPTVGSPRWRLTRQRRRNAHENAERHELESVDVENSQTRSGEQSKDNLDDEDRSKPTSKSNGQILCDVSSRALPGTLNFIIGPSGAGKSSLVDILSGRPKRGAVCGTLAWLCDPTTSSDDGPDPRRMASHRQIALVDQEDSVCLPAYMRVEEVLAFAAELSIPENVSRQERATIVEEVIETLGLAHVRRSLIGDARSRGISGGERRRVSLGIAMVGRPSVLIADECTSGLDAFSALRVAHALRRLASGTKSGTTVIATLHQPSSQVFDLADNVILLGSGQILFDGPPRTAMHFCQEAGVPVPPGHNVADHLLSYAFDVQDRRASPHTGAKCATRTTTDATDTHPRTPPSNDAAASQSKHVSASPLALNHGGGRPVTTFITQLHALVGRAMLMTKRDMLGAVAHIAGSAIVAVFVGACFFRIKLNLGGFQNRVGSMFFIFILLLFSGLSAITGVAKVRLLMMRERANGLYSPWSWAASHLLYDLLLLRAIPSILIVSVVYWMAALNHSAALFFQFLLIAVVYAWTIAIYNMIIAALVEDAGTTVLLAALFVVFNIFMAGFLMSLNSMPSAVRWLRWIVPTKYALEAVASNELKGLQFVDTFAGVPVRTDVSLFANSLFGFEDNSYYRDLIILACGFLVGFAFIFLTAVWWRMRELR